MNMRGDVNVWLSMEVKDEDKSESYGGPWKVGKNLPFDDALELAERLESPFDAEHDTLRDMLTRMFRASAWIAKKYVSRN